MSTGSRSKYCVRIEWCPASATRLHRNCNGGEAPQEYERHILLKLRGKSPTGYCPANKRPRGDTVDLGWCIACRIG